ncbi:MAG: hypothetical protein WA021_01855 [Minisyncoccia bacterium]
MNAHASIDISEDSRPNWFVKVSGDEFLTPSFLQWLQKIDLSTARIVICVGGGTQINEEFKRRGIPYRKHGPMGREHATREEEQIAEQVLQQNKLTLENKLCIMGISMHVIVPVLAIGGRLTHVNGDEMTRAAYLGFDKLFVLTTRGRLGAKRWQFRKLPKVEVMSLEPERLSYHGTSGR